MYTMCKLYKHNKQNKHNANLTMSPPLEPHAPQLENQAPWQATVVLVLVAIVVAVVTTAEVVVVAVVVAVVPAVVIVAVVPHVLPAFFNKIGFFVGLALKKLKLCCHFLSWKSSERRNNLSYISVTYPGSAG